MAKRGTTNGADQQKAVAIAAMTRAIKVLEGSMADKAVKLTEGAYPVDLTIGVAGDITVGAAVEAGKRTAAPALSEAEVLAGILATRKRPIDRLQLLGAGMRHAAAARAKDAKIGIKQLLADCDALMLQTAKAEKLTELKGSAAKAGKVEGKPSVTVRGSQAVGTIDVTVEAA